MSLKDRIKSRREAKVSVGGENCEFNISVKKVIKAIENVSNPADLGNIVKEFSRFLNTVSAQNTTITFKGNFDLGQRTLLNCVLSKFVCGDGDFDTDGFLNQEETKSSKLVRRRKSVRARLEAATKEESL